MSDGFWASLHLDILWPILVPQLLLMVKQWWDARQAKLAQQAAEAARLHSEAQRAEIVTRVDNLATVAIRSVDEVQNAKTAGIREGHVAGIEIGVKQASDFGQLRTGIVDVSKP